MKTSNITFCQYICAIMVIFGHQWELMGKSQPGGVLGLNIHGAGVYGLFAISGYLISNSYKKNSDIKSYTKKRAKRIFLPLVLCMLFTGVLGWTIKEEEVTGSVYIKGFLYYFLRNMCFLTYFRLPGVFARNPYAEVVNGSLWSLAPQMLCYVLVPLLCQKNGGRKRIWIFLILFVCSLLYSVSYCGFLKIGCEAWIVVILCFFIGVSVSQFQLEKYFKPQTAIVLAIVFSCYSRIFFPIASIYAVDYIILTLAITDKAIVSFRKKIKANINYELYLYAFPIQQWLIDLFVVKWEIYISTLCMFSMALGGTVTVSLTMSFLSKKIRSMYQHLDKRKI